MSEYTLQVNPSSVLVLWMRGPYAARLLTRSSPGLTSTTSASLPKSPLKTASPFVGMFEEVRCQVAPLSSE